MVEDDGFDTVIPELPSDNVVEYTKPLTAHEIRQVRSFIQRGHDIAKNDGPMCNYTEPYLLNCLIGLLEE